MRKEKNKMSLLRKKKGSFLSPELKSPIKINLNSNGVKSSIVSSVVKQLTDQGYSGNLLRNSGMEYAIENPSREPEVNEMDSLDYTEDNLLVDDIDFEASKDSNNIKTKVNAGEPISRKELLQRQRKTSDERIENSQKQVKLVNKSSKELYKSIDSFIVSLHGAADNSGDNKILCMKLERLRKMCVSFTRGIQSNMPGYASSLYVTPEDSNGQRR